MKKIVLIVALALATVAGSHAQSIYDGVKMSQKDLNGTARFVGMGGAMSALGGDISTMGTNPAGIGIYRSNDIMTSFSFSAYGTESDYLGSKQNVDKNHWSFDNIGFVLSSKVGNQTPLRYVNFGFNYQKSKSLYKNMSMMGLLNTDPKGEIVTQTYQMANQANGATREELGTDDVYDNNNIGWLSALGWNGFLINEDLDSPYSNMYTPYTHQVPFSTFRSEERGGVEQYDFNVSFNINDRVYLGATVGAYSVNYKKNTFYDEDFQQEGGYSLESFNKITGSGVDFKFGVIFRPIESSPLRIGASIHSPIFYNLKLSTSAVLSSKTYQDGKLVDSYIDTYNGDNRFGGVLGDMKYEYNLRTPWTYNLSLGYTVGSSLALGAEYEYEDYSTMSFKDVDGYKIDFGNESSEPGKLKGVSTFRIGAEYKVIPEFAFRLGYNYTSAAFDESAIKFLRYNSINTDTDFANTKAMNNYTMGIGYRGDIFYADLAYKYSTYKEDFYAFQDTELKSTKVTNTRSQVLLTLGVRF